MNLGKLSHRIGEMSIACLTYKGMWFCNLP